MLMWIRKIRLGIRRRLQERKEHDQMNIYYLLSFAFGAIAFLYATVMYLMWKVSSLQKSIETLTNPDKPIIIEGKTKSTVKEHTDIPKPEATPPTQTLRSSIYK